MSRRRDRGRRAHGRCGQRGHGRGGESGWYGDCARARAADLGVSCEGADGLLRALGDLHGGLTRRVRVRGARTDDWDDAVQDAAVRVLIELRRGRHAPDLPALERRVADRASGIARRERRRRERLRGHAFQPAEAEQAAASDVGDVRGAAGAPMARLDPFVHGAVLLLLHGLRLPEAAEVLAVPSAVLHARLQRAARGAPCGTLECSAAPEPGEPRGARLIRLRSAGWSVAEIAHAEGLTCGAVRVGLHRARRRV